MFRRLDTLSILAAATLLASTTFAQGAAWDRRISDIHIVHPPGTPPGKYVVHAALEFGSNDTVPTGLDLSSDVTITLNGVPIHLDHIAVSTLTVSQCTLGGQCTVGAGCTSYLYDGILHLGVCAYVIVPNLGCTCWDAVDHNYTDFLLPTDVLGVTIAASPGSVPEVETSDDTFSITVGEHDPATTFCSGDGTLPTPCPCGNTGASGHGCANSQNASGALIAATGFTEADPITGTDTVVLHGSGMPSSVSAIYLKSDASNPAGSVFGDGVSCLTGSIIRLRTKVNVGGASQFPEPGDPSLSVRGATPPGSGLVGHYAVYYRNAAAAFCPPATYNISNALSIAW